MSDRLPVTLVDVLGSLDGGPANRTETLPAAIGLDDNGHGVVADLGDAALAIVAGPDGSGKSTAVNAIVCSLLMNRSPLELNLLLFDPTRVELAQYRGARHLVRPLISNADEALSALRWLDRARTNRLDSFRQAGVRHLRAYNESGVRPPLPHLVFVGEEFETLLQSNSEAGEVLASVTRDAEAVGIHLVLSMPTDVASETVRLVSHDWRHVIVFGRVSDEALVRAPSDPPARIPAYSLLYQPPGFTAAMRLRGVMVADSELRAIREAWGGGAWHREDH